MSHLAALVQTLERDTPEVQRQLQQATAQPEGLTQELRSFSSSVAQLKDQIEAGFAKIPGEMADLQSTVQNGTASIASLSDELGQGYDTVARSIQEMTDATLDALKAAAEDNEVLTQSLEVGRQLLSKLSEQRVATLNQVLARVQQGHEAMAQASQLVHKGLGELDQLTQQTQKVVEQRANELGGQLQQAGKSVESLVGQAQGSLGQFGQLFTNSVGSLFDGQVQKQVEGLGQSTVEQIGGQVKQKIGSAFDGFLNEGVGPFAKQLTDSIGNSNDLTKNLGGFVDQLGGAGDLGQITESGISAAKKIISLGLG